MKTLIIYFSQTGNTRQIAERIHDGIARVTGQCDIRPLSDIDNKSLLDYDLVGLGSPVFYYKEPFHVRDFIESLPELSDRHWFIFCTHGNVIGNFFSSVADLLKKKKAIVIGYHNSYANITVPYYPRPSYTSGHPDAYDLEQAEAFGREMAERSPKITGPDSGLIPEPGPVSSEEWIQDSHRMTQKALKKVMPKFSLNIETCIRCHQCEDDCPVHGIDVESDPPVLQEPCIFCLRCVNICPTASIVADWTSLVAMAPANFARYKKELDRVTARGEFRWLVDPDRIDLSDPLYKQREREIRSRETKGSGD